MGKRKTTDDFITKAKKVYGGKYDYSETVYTGCYNKLKIICHKKDEDGVEHGAFYPRACNHLSKVGGCPKCSKHNKYDTEVFIKDSEKKHGQKYDYSLVNYINCDTNVKIICHEKKTDGDEHGIFEVTPYNHIRGTGCPICENREKITTEEFIKRAKAIHGDKYDYSLAEYVNAFTKVKIICKKHNLVFEQTPHHHLNGHGCPVCSASLMETKIRSIFENNGIKYVQQKRFSWLKYKKSLSLDFYLPEQNIAIECQGEQHVEKVYYRSKKWSEEKAQKNLSEILIKDKIKRKQCEENGVKIFYIMSEQLYSKADHTYYTKENTVLFKTLNKLNINDFNCIDGIVGQTKKTGE